MSANLINQASQKTEEKLEQLDFWSKLGDTRVVADVVTTGPTPWQAEDRDAKAPGRADAQRSGRGATTLDRGKSGTAWAKAGAAKGKARIVAARHGNAFIVTRRRKD